MSEEIVTKAERKQREGVNANANFSGKLCTSNDERTQELAEAHWNYSYYAICLGRNPNRVKADIATVGWIYKQAFVHGYKHGKEEVVG
ncbi:MAG: hypothetical protein ABIG63_08680 [Chloroflexota bacterium]